MTRRLAAAGASYALTGAAAFDRRSSMRSPDSRVTIWVDGAGDLADLLAVTGARPAETAVGANIDLRQVPGDAPLAFSRSSGGVLVANPVRIYLDLLAGPVGGGARAVQLRRALAGR